MCNRHLSFKTSSICGHLILVGSQNVDCGDPECYNSSAHPPDCAARSGRANCDCRRYYTYAQSPLILSPTHPLNRSQPKRVVASGQVLFLPRFPPPASPSSENSPNSWKANVRHAPLDLRNTFLVVFHDLPLSCSVSVDHLGP